MSSTYARAKFYITVVPIIWGTTFAITKSSLDDISPVFFALIRFAITIVIFLVGVRVARTALRIAAVGRTRQDRDLRLDSIVLGGLLGGGYALQFVGLLTSSTTNSAFITSTAAIWTPIFAYFVIGETISKRIIAAIGIALVGLVLLTKPYEIHNVVVGDFLTVLSAMCFGFYIAWIDRAMPRTIALFGDEVKAGLAISSNQLVAATLVIGISMLVVESPRVSLTGDLVWATLYTAIFATALTTYLQNRYQHVPTATVAALIFMLEPVVAAIIGFIFLNEVLESVQLFGAVLIIVGVIVAQLRFPDRAQ